MKKQDGIPTHALGTEKFSRPPAGKHASLIQSAIQHSRRKISGVVIQLAV
jgi:hypothetical protein